MNLDFSILADGASPRPDGKIDIFGAAFDTIFAAATPARHTQLALVVRFLLSTHELEEPHKFKVVLLAEDGGELARLEAQIDAMSDDDRNQVPAGEPIGISNLFNMAGIVFPDYGRYHFVLSWDGTELREPIRLKVAPLPSQS